MTPAEEKTEITNACKLAAAVVLLALVVCALVGCCDCNKEPTQVLPAPGEHSVLVEGQK